MMQFTQITSLNPSRLSKQFSLSLKGTLVKQMAGQIAEGTFQVIKYPTIAEFAQLLPTLKENQALCYGRPDQVSGRLLSKYLKAGRNDREAVTRSRECFSWPSGPAIFFGDYDPPAGSAALTPEELLATLYEVMPELRYAPMVLWHSASSHIYHKQTGDALKGPGGVRLYIMVADGRDIPRFGEVLFKRLWLNSYGRYDVSKSGVLLARSLLDAAVWQPERLDFAAGAVIDAHQPIEQRRPLPQLINPNAVPFYTNVFIPDLTADEERELAALQEREREKMKPQQDQMRKAWIEERLLMIGNEQERECKRTVLENAVMHRKLFADFELITCDNGRITVGEILDNPDPWHHQYLKDPLEPDYHEGANVGWLNLRSGGKPYLYSHAHGGARYALYRQTQTINVTAGELPSILNEAATIIGSVGETYQRGGQLVRIAGADILPVTEPWLKNHIEKNIHFLRYDARSRQPKPADSPTELAKRYLHNRGAWQEPELSGLLNAPLFRLDGTLLAEPGYDKKTGLLLRCQHPLPFPPVPHNPSRPQLIEAFSILWEPFRLFPFVSPDDNAAALAAMLTAIQRPVLPTAPAFAFNAHVAGSGKTYLAKAISGLSGDEPREMPWSTEVEEQRKRLTAALLNGHSNVLIDNVNGLFDSDTLCSILTGERYEDRRLGFSENLKLKTCTLFLITGNNLTVVKDLWRRVIMITIDHGIEKPSKQSFPFNPVAQVREHWQQYRAAGLTLLSAYIAAGSPRITKDSVGSFEVWNDTIRQCVLWLRDNLSSIREEGLPELGDPINLLDQSYEADPERERLEQFLVEWHTSYGSLEKKIAEVLKEVEIPLNITKSLSGELLSDISGGNKPNSRMIAAFMRRNEGRIVKGYSVHKGKSYGSRSTWFVRKDEAFCS